MSTVIDLAREMSQAFVVSERPSGEQFHKLREGHPQWMKDVLYELHGGGRPGTRFPSDSVYEAASKVLDRLSELDDDASEEEMEDAVREIEPDVYNSELIEWLGEHPENAGYVDEAMEQFQPEGVIQAIAVGQQLQIEEIGSGIIRALQDRAEEEEED